MMHHLRISETSMIFFKPDHAGFVRSDATWIDENGVLHVENEYHGNIIYGPYASVKSGIYEITIDIVSDEKYSGVLHCDIYAGGCTYGGGQIKNTKSFFVRLPDTNKLEIRLTAQGGRLALRGVGVKSLYLDHMPICPQDLAILLSSLPKDCETEILFELSDRLNGDLSGCIGERLKASIVERGFGDPLRRWRRIYEIINSSCYAHASRISNGEIDYESSLASARNLVLKRVTLRPQYDRHIDKQGYDTLLQHGYNPEAICATAAYRDPTIPKRSWQSRHSPSAAESPPLDRSLVTEALARIDLGFQDSVAQGKGVAAFCPISGEKLYATHGFAHHFNASIQNIYRFDGIETFYLFTGAYPNSKMFLFFPKTGIYADFEDQGIRWYNYEDLIREFCAELVRCKDEIILYLQNSFPPKAAVFGLSNIGHFFWNEMGGIDHAINSGSMQYIDKIFTVPSQFADYKKIFPEIGMITHVDIDTSRAVFQTVLKNGCTPIHFTSGAITETLFARMRQAVLRHAQPIVVKKRPLIWINVRAGNKIWLDQADGYANILNEIKKEYGEVSAIVQGMPDCKEIYDEIVAKVDKEVEIINGLDLDIFDKFSWASLCDAYICVAGAAMTFLVWFANVPGVAHSEHAHLDHIAWWSDARPEALPIFAPEKSQVEEVGSGWYCNYRVDWRILLELLRKALRIQAV